MVSEDKSVAFGIFSAVILVNDSFELFEVVDEHEVDSNRVSARFFRPIVERFNEEVRVCASWTNEKVKGEKVDVFFLHVFIPVPLSVRIVPVSPRFSDSIDKLLNCFVWMLS